MRCEDVAILLPQVLEGAGRADGGLVDHVDSCLRCQAELARYRRMLRLLAQLRVQRPAVPAGAVAGVLAAIEARAKKGAVRSALGGRRVAVVGGVSVALVAATTAAALVALGRGRSRRPAQAARATP